MTPTVPWVWPLKGASPLFPDEVCGFGAVRLHDIHTGVDLFCELGQEVIAVEDGVVILVEGFTGPNADSPSPWWNDTQAILVRGASGVVTYGEIKSLVAVGDQVKVGQVVGVVEKPVLRSFKGRPMVMLHVELMTHDAIKTEWWKAGEPMPPTLRDPMPFLMEAAGANPSHFEMRLYQGKRFRDPSAKMKPSEWWAMWLIPTRESVEAQVTLTSVEPYLPSHTGTCEVVRKSDGLVLGTVYRRHHSPNVNYCGSRIRKVFKGSQKWFAKIPFDRPSPHDHFTTSYHRMDRPTRWRAVELLLRAQVNQ